VISDVNTLLLLVLFLHHAAAVQKQFKSRVACKLKQAIIIHHHLLFLTW
jgi:hypothetical protein